MPALEAVGVECVALTLGEARLSAPLDRNQNDKGTAFAGSLNGLGLLTGWLLTQRVAFEFSAETQCAVFDARTRFRQPVHGPLLARCKCSLTARTDVLLALEQAGRARWTLEIEVGSETLADAVRMTADYAIWTNKPGPHVP